MENNQEYLDLLDKILRKYLPQRNASLYQFWKRYILSSAERGKELTKILGRYTKIRGSKILDVGCGDGGVAIAFAKCGGKVGAIDANKDFIKLARLKVNGYCKSKVAFKLGCMENIKFPDESFDIVICNDVLEHVSDLEKSIQEISRVLKCGGTLYLSVPNKISIVNFLSDPHYGLFGVSVLPKSLAAWYVSKIRKGIHYSTNYSISSRYLTKRFAKNNVSLYLIAGGKIIEKIKKPDLVCNSFHKNLLLTLNKLGLSKITVSLAKNSNFFNRYIHPTNHFIGKKHNEINSVSK